jgi:CheY-like chemotaxis protein
VAALIMIVDDEHAIVDTLSEVLTWHGYEVMSAPNGKLALAAMETRCPSLVLLDNMMPVLNGMNTLAAMRRDAALAKVPVIMMSAMPEPVPPDGASWNEYLRKPFRAPVLLAAIARCLGTKPPKPH